MPLRTSTLALLFFTAPTAMAAPGGFGGFGGFGGRTSGGITAVVVDTECITGHAFDGACITNTNAEEELGLTPGSVLGVFACEDDAGETVSECLMVQVDEGDYPSRYTDYLIEPTSCTAGFFATEICLGDYETNYRAVHEVDEWAFVHDLYRTDVVTHQVVETVRLSPRWVDESVTTVEADATGSLYAARGIEYVVTVTHETPDGELLDEETILGGIIADGGDVHGTTAAELCATLKSGREEVSKALGSGTSAVCHAMNPLQSIEAFGFGASGNASLCGALGTGMQDSLQIGGSDVYNSCLQNPGAFFPINFANTGVLGPDGSSIMTSIPLSSSEAASCEELDGSQVRVTYERGAEGGGVETCTVWAELECEGGGEDCACTGSPMGDPICE
jgi:hypothetical protein